MRNEMDTVLENVKRYLQESQNIVCVTGLRTVVEAGGIDIWDRDNLYRIEKEYNASPEELLSAGVFATKKEKFYDFYKKETLTQLPTPGPAFYALKKLQDVGKLKMTVSMNIYGLEYGVGLHNVVEIQGNIHSHYCPECRNNFSPEYVRDSVGVPVCNKCKVAIRPGIRLFGERVRNDLYTAAAQACADADMVIVLGTNLYGEKVQYVTGHYKGSRLVLINDKPHFSDRYADYVLYGRTDEILPRMVDEL